MDEYLEQTIDDDPRQTIALMTTKVKIKFDVQISTSTLSRKLDGKFSLKLIRPNPAPMNLLQNKFKRKEYVQQIQLYLQNYSEEVVVVWMDESNCNLFCTRTQGKINAPSS